MTSIDLRALADACLRAACGPVPPNAEQVKAAQAVLERELLSPEVIDLTPPAIRKRLDAWIASHPEWICTPHEVRALVAEFNALWNGYEALRRWSEGR